MLLPLHNWKDKIKNFIRKYPKSTIVVLVIFLALMMIMLGTQGARALWPFDVLADAAIDVANGVLAAFLSVICMILYYVVLIPLFWLVAIVIQIMVYVASWQSFIHEPTVIAGWTIARDLVNVGFIAILLYIAFGTIINYQKVNWQKDLVKLIIAVVLVNFSRMIVGLVIDLSQIIMLTFVNGFRNIAAGNILETLGLNMYLEGAKEFTVNIKTAADHFIRLSIGIMMALLILSILTIMTAWLLLRVIKLWLLTIMVPFYFLADFFPFLKQFHSYWEKEFTDQLVAGPFMAFGIWFAMSVISQTGQPNAITTPQGTMADAQAIASTVQDGSVTKQSSVIFSLAIGAGLLYGVFDMSKRLAGPAATVGQTVFSKGKSYLKSGVKTVGKYADIGIARVSKDYLHHDLSVGGVRDYAKELKQSWGAKVEAFKARGDKGLKNYREKTLLDKKTKSSPVWQQALNKRLEAQAKRQALSTESKNKNKEMEENIRQDQSNVDLGEKIQNDLLGRQAKGTEAEGRRQNLENIMNKVKSGDFSDMKSLMADSFYNFSDDFKNKVQGIEGKSKKKGIVDKIYQESISDNGGIMSQHYASRLVDGGILTQEEANHITGVPLSQLNKINPKLAKKLNSYNYGQDQSDILTSLQEEHDKESEIANDGARVTAVLDKWKIGKLDEQEVQDLGMSGAEQNLLTTKSLTDISNLQIGLVQKRADQKAYKSQVKGQLKDYKQEIAAAERQMATVARNIKENYLKSTSTRAIEGRFSRSRDILLKDMQARFPNHDTPEDLAEIALHQPDPEAQEFAINSLQAEDVPEFMKYNGAKPDLYGIYEVVLGLGKQLNEHTQELINQARAEGNDLPQDKEAELMQALNASISDAYNKEIIQKFLKKSRTKIPSAKHVLNVDKTTGDVEFTSFKVRREKDVEAIERGEIPINQYTEFARELSDGSLVLDQVGEQIFQKYFGQINKYNIHTYESHFLQALVQNKEQILQNLGSNNPNYEKIKKVLEEVSNRIYQPTSSLDNDFENLKSNKP